MQIRLIASAALVAASACVRSYVPPEERVFAPGRYEYEAVLVLPGASEETQYLGALVLDSVTADSLAGRWEVEGYDALLRENRWNVASYEVHARMPAVDGDSLTVIHHVKRGRDPERPECTVSITRTGYIQNGWCSLRLVR